MYCSSSQYAYRQYRLIWVSDTNVSAVFKAASVVG